MFVRRLRPTWAIPLKRTAVRAKALAIRGRIPPCHIRFSRIQLDYDQSILSMNWKKAVAERQLFAERDQNQNVGNRPQCRHLWLGHRKTAATQ